MTMGHIAAQIRNRVAPSQKVGRDLLPISSE